MFRQISTSAADDAAVNPNGIKTSLANVPGIFFISCKPVFSNSPKFLPRNPLECTF